MFAAYSVRELISCILPLLVRQQIADAFVTKNSSNKGFAPGRERLSLNEGWRFLRRTEDPDNLIYDRRPDLGVENSTTILKPWILPSGNNFINDPVNQHQRPAGNPGGNFTFVQKTFDDSSWDPVNLPHDWAIKGPFYSGANAVVGGGMGRLPIQGVGWYRKTLTKLPEDDTKSIYLDIDGAMSYAMVWLNGNLVGGWPYGYNSFRLDLTQYLNPGDNNQLAIRLDNPTDSSRWYPGGGIYRNVWLTKVESIHVAQYGTFVTTRDVSAQTATIDITVHVENKGLSDGDVAIVTEVYALDSATGGSGEKIAEFPRMLLSIPAAEKPLLNSTITLSNPRLWGPLSTQRIPNLYVAVTHIYSGSIAIDSYETRFGIRSLAYDATNGLLVNGEKVRIQGVSQHHDLGAIGTAFNIRAAERQLEILREMGTNAIRMSHNPPAPELLDLTDRMGFLVLDEIFDCWELNKTSSDFHLIFDDWHEPDLRAFIRRDRNHPSIIAWSFGNEVGEQYTDVAGAALAQKLHDIVHEEDPTRPSTASMNYAKPDMPFPVVMDILALNYQGEGIRDSAAYANLSGIKTPPLYPDFHAKFPGKLLFSSETASALSSRGTFLFPVTNETSAPVNDGMGGNSLLQLVSAYELYSANFGSSPDKVFAAQNRNPYVAGEFVWSGFDYLGEPTPYDASRSSYFGIIDLAGFPKDRFYLYQSRWRPDLRMAHILPHWTWPNRVGLVTPVHVFSAADEAELFLNGQSQGRIRKEAYEYRFRWDEVVYQPGELHVVTYKNGTSWANDTVKTAGSAAQLQLIADRKTIRADGRDLSYITITILDSRGVVVPQGDNPIAFSVSGPGEIVATDNGDPASLVPFPSKVRKAYSDLALVIVRATAGVSGTIIITASGDGLASANVRLEALL